MGLEILQKKIGPVVAEEKQKASGLNQILLGGQEGTIGGCTEEDGNQR